MKNHTLLSTVGNTPMVQAQNLCTRPDIELWFKLEFMNPSGSVKDRMVKHIIEHAEASGKLQPGGTIIENTSGNTGAAIAMIAAMKGYQALLTMPDKVSNEKQNALKAYGARIIVCPTEAKPDNQEHYVNKARALAAETPNSFYLNQYDNPMNPDAHYLTTGPEIWKQTNGSVDIFIASGSTGGTITGVGRYLKEKKPSVHIVMPDPVGSIYYNYWKSGVISKESNCSYRVEGIGEDHIAKAMDFSVVDEMIQFTDQDAFDIARRLSTEEGILAGGSSGANVWGALQLIKKLEGPATIVTVIPDSGIKYLSKFLNNDWMQKHGYIIN